MFRLMTAAACLFAFAALGQTPAAPPPSTSGAPPTTESPTPAAPSETTPVEPAGPKTYAMDAKRTQLVIQVFKDGAAAALAHDHTVHATEISGEIVADPASPSSAKINITAQTKSLVNDDPQVRKQFGLDPAVPEKDRQAVNESMKGEDQLHVAKYPTISFNSTSVEPLPSDKGGDKFTLVGDFTLRGVTKKLKLPITVKIEGNTLIGDGKVRFKQSDWGMKPYSAFLGAVKNKDELVLNVHVVGVAK